MEIKIGEATMENSMEILQKFKIELPYFPAIPHLSIYLKEIKSISWRDLCTFIFIAALFAIAKIYKQSNGPETKANKIMCVCIYIYIIYNIAIHMLSIH